MKTRHLTLLAAVALAALASAPYAHARGGHYRGGGHYHGGARVGVFIGAPALAYGWYGYGYRPYYPYYYPPAYVPAPVVVQPATPPVYIERPDAQAATPAAPSEDYWYYCQDTNSYYPYVGTCASPWQRVAPQPQQAPQS